MTPENTFIASVHRHLRGKCYFEKTHNEYRGGTPDVYYEGSSQSFWAEYKFLKNDPKRQFTPKLSELQKEWLKRNFDNGHAPWVIVGCPNGGFILETPREWENPVLLNGLLKYGRTSLAEHILKRVNRQQR